MAKRTVEVHVVSTVSSLCTVEIDEATSDLQIAIQGVEYHASGYINVGGVQLDVDEVEREKLRRFVITASSHESLVAACERAKKALQGLGQREGVIEQPPVGASA